MSGEQRDVLRVSDCHHGRLLSHLVEDLDKDGKSKSGDTGFTCSVCKQVCKSVELLVEEK